MSRESNQTKSLQAAMIERAKKLATEHISQGNLSRQKIMQNAREKIHLMEQKELLLAKSLSEREYLRKVEAREIHLQAELDRNRWGLVQTVMEQLRHHLQTLQQQPDQYHPLLLSLFKEGADLIEDQQLIAHLNSNDHLHYTEQWEATAAEVTFKTVLLSNQPIHSMGGIKLTSSDGSIMLDNTFEGLLEQQQRALQKVIFERLFATVDGKGALLHG